MSDSRLSLSAFVALRYLRSTRRDAYITFLSLSATGGIFLGVAALILALAALNGFQTALRNETLARTPHIEVEVPPKLELEGIERLVETIDGVIDTQALVRGHVWILALGRARAAEMVGYRGDLPLEFPGATDRSPGLYVSNRLAETWGLTPGETVELASSRPTLTPFGPQPRIRRLPVVGVFASGRSEQSERVALPLAEAQLLTGQSQIRLLVRTDSLSEATRVAERLRGELPEEVMIKTWRDLNRPLFFALRLEKTLMFIAVFLIVIVAAMALVSDLMLILASKQSEVGMLGAMGASPRRLRKIFLHLGTLLVSLGSILGMSVGIAAAWTLDHFRVLSLPEQVYFLDYVPFLVRFRDVAWIVGATLLLTLSCALVASRRASSLTPVEALRK